MPDIEHIARGVWIEQGRVLLCKNLRDHFYYLPGGHIEFGEPAAKALSREFIEETGIPVQVTTPAMVMEHVFHDGKREHHEFLLVFHVEHADETSPPLSHHASIPSREPDIAFEWVDLGVVIDLDLRPVPLRAWLASGGRIDSSVGWLSAPGTPDSH